MQHWGKIVTNKTVFVRHSNIYVKQLSYGLGKQDRSTSKSGGNPVQ